MYQIQKILCSFFLVELPPPNTTHKCFRSYFFFACECRNTATVTTPDPSMKGRLSSNPKSGIEMSVVKSIATEVEYTLVMLFAYFITMDTARPDRAWFMIMMKVMLL